ncbi:hypothetical protein BDP81DRAFT_432425 [Colletotrichum phormii]|uniref:Uncharacterized protein n=1 Tax=Colletotrichum phormii TaxID=359342 RepID=A0AAJ0ECQ8_9PEZI|nr:uncharacterized protein BDP81DRAFT_432425 [Colletotrichum phormii]KAK1634239.1 hypothetical protein BDP81DRAFT_432425 [Colletotrichum phormii]
MIWEAFVDGGFFLFVVLESLKFDHVACAPLSAGRHFVLFCFFAACSGSSHPLRAEREKNTALLFLTRHLSATLYRLSIRNPLLHSLPRTYVLTCTYELTR